MSHDIPNNALILVADGGKAMLLRNTAPSGGEVSLTEEGRITPESAAQGPSGSRPEDQTPGQTSEATFSKQVAQALNALKQQNGFDALVLVADPQSLGQIREALHKTVDAAVIKSLSKDLTNHSLDDIAKALVK
ncbi:host attachment protein [Roseomonas aerophila]|uniref:Host attachment protein n=1 Tax=Teichococcus aerophilus TaxID=1224513 RepID=A0ABR7RMR7_9PROT|nr:host attachment family protein [Pseudoroseomonas aerophila]MBC9207613.1 host attachment protein [Pseudoroseomonas aerophila]